MTLPELSAYHLHKVLDDIDLDGVAVPGLRGAFHRRPRGDGRVETVGVYTWRGSYIFMAWGYVGEDHCRHTAYHDGVGWSPPHVGCPDLARVLLRLGDDDLAAREPAHVGQGQPGQGQ